MSRTKISGSLLKSLYSYESEFMVVMNSKCHIMEYRIHIMKYLQK
jgi:hypothetical protein